MNLKLLTIYSKETHCRTSVSKEQETTIGVIGLDVILIYREESSEGSEGEGD